MCLNFPKIVTGKESLEVSTHDLVKIIFILFQTVRLFYQSKKEWQILGNTSVGSLLFPTWSKTQTKRLSDLSL